MKSNQHAKSIIPEQLKLLRKIVPTGAMKFCFLTAALIAVALPVFALDGTTRTHDPTTIMLCNGKYYSYGTGGATLVSDDGWIWRGGASVPGGGGMGPDMIRVGDYYYMYVASNVGAQPRSQIVMKKTKSLDPESPDYKWEQMGLVNSTDGVEFCNGIDPACFLDPTTGKFWLTFGSYFGYIRLVELDPKTGLRIDDKYRNLAINCEASCMIYHDGWYYLFGTHGSCCNGASSGYHIRVGRSKSVTGPFVDQTGIDMIQGGGKLLIGSGGRYVGAGHFGLFDEGENVQKFSLHWEADLDKGGSVLDVRPLIWKDGWPIAGELFKAGTYEIESARTGTAIELAVEGVAVGGGRGGRGGGGMMGGGRGTRGAGAAPGGRGGVPGAAAGGVPGAAMGGAPDAGGRGGMGAGAGMGGGMMGGRGGGSPVPDQNAAQVSANWPAGNVDVRLSNYMCQAQQKWTVTPAEGKGGVLGSPYFKITIAGTDRTLAATEDGELITLAQYTGSDEQLWRIEQFTDSTWRVKPKSIPNSKESLCLSAIGSSFATLAKFDPNSDKQKWLFKTP
jgi:arabinan endo-1,5-alpha-L-arabinosidase